MPPKKRPLNRDSGVLRDASLIVIASEDTYAVEDYFKRFKARKIQVEVLPTEDGCSAPADVMERLDNFKKTVATEDHDQFWLCIDKDHWANPGQHIANLRQVLQHCKQKGYQVAISNPCFELWLLLHYKNVEATAGLTCKQIEKELSEIAGGYTKKSCGRLLLTGTMVNEAVTRARSLDVPESMIPDTLVTRVYQIISALQARDAIDLT